MGEGEEGKGEGGSAVVSGRGVCSTHSVLRPATNFQANRRHSSFDAVPMSGWTNHNRIRGTQAAHGSCTPDGSYVKW